MWFNGWDSIGRILVVGILGYVALIALLRVSGKRTLSKMNAFDFIVTITLGSAFGGLLLNSSVSLADGVAAIALLIVLQWVVSAIYVRSTWFEKMVKGEPQLLYDRTRRSPSADQFSRRRSRAASEWS